MSMYDRDYYREHHRQQKQQRQTRARSIISNRWWSGFPPWAVWLLAIVIGTALVKVAMEARHSPPFPMTVRFIGTWVSRCDRPRYYNSGATRQQIELRGQARHVGGSLTDSDDSRETRRNRQRASTPRAVPVDDIEGPVLAGARDALHVQHRRQRGSSSHRLRQSRKSTYGPFHPTRNADGQLGDAPQPSRLLKLPDTQVTIPSRAGGWLLRFEHRHDVRTPEAADRPGLVKTRVKGQAAGTHIHAPLSGLAAQAQIARQPAGDHCAPLPSMGLNSMRPMLCSGRDAGAAVLS